MIPIGIKKCLILELGKTIVLCVWRGGMRLGGARERSTVRRVEELPCTAFELTGVIVELSLLEP